MTYVAFLLGLLELVAIYFAFKAVGSARTPQGSVAWVVFLLTAPYAGIVLYLFLGHSKVNTYIVTRRVSAQVIQAASSSAKAHPPRDSGEIMGLSAFEKVAELPVLSGNSMQLLIDGEETFEAIFAALDNARDYVLAQSYIIRDDIIGRAFQDRLIACADRGVKVRLLFDAVGCNNLPDSYLDTLRAAGVQVMNIHDVRGPKTRFHINFRNHRKTVVVDGTTGFIGGLNVGDEYMGRDPDFGDWRDTHCRIEGPIVSQLQLVYCEDWHWATEGNLIPQLNWDPGRSDADMDGLIMATGPADEMETGSLYFCAAISAARERLWIASPYLVPENDILTALKLAALRGVDVRILVPEVVDHKITWLAAFAYFDELMEAGVKILRYNAGFMHQKALVVDDSLASVGTMNMDNRSCRLNFEETAIFFDKDAADAVARMLADDFTRATPLALKLADQRISVRYGAKAARLFAPIL